MNVAGNLSKWVDLFPENLIPDILSLIIYCWKSFKMPMQNEHEVPITIRFCAALRNQKALDKLPFIIDTELSELDAKRGRISSRLDLRFIQGYDENTYFAFECKRLHVEYPSGKRAQYSEYYGEQGMGRYISGQYAKGLIHSGMIAYVMDGKNSKAIKEIDKQIRKNSIKLKIIGNNGLSDSSFLCRSNVRETNHNLGKNNFTIQHIFLAVKK
jgi:hypothetical protein